MQTINLTVSYYALLREQRGLSRETVATTATTADQLYGELAERHGLTLPVKSLKVAINDEFASWQSSLNPGDEIVFLPPMAGG